MEQQKEAFSISAQGKLLRDSALAKSIQVVSARILPRLKACGLAVEWKVADLPAVQYFGPHKALQVMRILQEAITNVIKHAKASKLTFTARLKNTEEQESCVIIGILDDGMGLGEQAGQGRGINNMRRRTESIGGAIDIQDTGKGVRLRFSLPWAVPASHP